MNSKITFWALLLVGLFSLSAMAQEKTPAFPGAEGFGRYVTGGRGGKVIHVTNLNDSGTGSLREAVATSGTRTIVFDVSGTIHLESSLPISQGNVTIAGQTAPGDGICVADYPMSISANNVIIRYMRFRLGNKNVTLNGADGWDALGALDQQNIIVDHCSVSWSIDECLSFGGCKNTTVQWCIVSQSLAAAGHSKGSHGYGGNWGGSGASYHHNLLAHHASRTPRLGPRYTTQLDERMDMRNNVIYNFGGNGCYGGEAMNVNIVNNYYKPGAATKSGSYQYRIAGLGIRTNSYIESYAAYAPTLHVWGKYYVDGNVNPRSSKMTSDNWTYGIYEQISASSNDNLYNQDVKDSIRLSEPIDFVYTTTHSAEDAFERVLDYAGASLHRDALDDVMVSDARNGKVTYGISKNGIIDSQDDLGSDPWPTLNSSTAPTDTDGDGMPDEWEDANGLNKNDAADGPLDAGDGYTNLEHYLNSLVEDITNAQNAGGEALGNIQTVGNQGETAEYEISKQTHTTDEASNIWGFEGGFTISNEKNKGYSTGNNNGIKFSNNVAYTLNIPDGISIEKINIAGYGNHADAYLAALGETTYSATDYPFPNGDDGSTADHTISLAEPATGSLTFKPSGAQAVWKFILYTAAATSISEAPQCGPAQQNVYATDGRLLKANASEAYIKALPAGIYIIGNRTCVVK